MSFNGDLYPNTAEAVMTTKGDVVRFDSQRERYGIGSTNQVLSVTAGLPAWKTLTTADSVLTTQGDILYEDASGLARLGFGTSGDVLTTKGTGANPEWSTPVAGDPDFKYLSTHALTSANHVLEATNIFADYDVIWIEYYLEEASTTFEPLFNVYQTGGGLASSTGFQESIDYGASGATAGGSDLPLDGNVSGTANTSIGRITLINGNGSGSGSDRYGGGFVEYQMMVAGTSNAPASVGNLNFKLNNTTQMIGIKFYNGTGTDLLATDSYFNVFVGRDIS